MAHTHKKRRAGGGGRSKEDGGVRCATKEVEKWMRWVGGGCRGWEDGRKVRERLSAAMPTEGGFVEHWPRRAGPLHRPPWQSAPPRPARARGARRVCTALRPRQPPLLPPPPPPAVGGRRGGRPHQCAVTQPLPRRPRPRRAAAAVAAGVCRAADAGRAPFPPPPSSHSAAALAGLHPRGGATPAGAGRAQPQRGGRAGALDLGSIEPTGSRRRDAFCLRPPPSAPPPPPPPPGGQRRPPLKFSNARTPPPASRWPGAGHTADWRALTPIRGQPTRDTGWVEGTGGYAQ